MVTSMDEDSVCAVKMQPDFRAGHESGFFLAALSRAICAGLQARPDDAGVMANLNINDTDRSRIHKFKKQNRSRFLFQGKYLRNTL